MNQEIVTKKCSKCQEVKTIDEFHNNKNTKDKHSAYCKCCNCKRTIYWSSTNSNKKKQQNKQYRINHPNLDKLRYQKNPNERKLSAKRYIQRNPKQVKVNARLYRQKRYQNDLNFKTTNNIRSRINMALKNNIKYEHSLEQLGCTIIENNQHIELQFYKNMSFDTQGRGTNHWQIHHICPIEFFDITDPIEQKQAFHFTNTRPLWYEDHVEEHRKINERMSQYENNGRPIYK